MTKLRLLPTLALAAALALPAATSLAQDDAEVSPTPIATAAADDTRLEELRELVPEALAGLALREELQLATGEELAEHMSAEERTIIEGMLAEQGKTLADYAAGSASLPITDTDAVVVQAHRVSGADASDAIDDWIELLGLNATEQGATERVMADREVSLLTDSAQPEVPPLYLFPAEDVVWMVVAADEAFVEEAVAVLSQASETPTETTAGD